MGIKLDARLDVEVGGVGCVAGVGVMADVGGGDWCQRWTDVGVAD